MENKTHRWGIFSMMGTYRLWMEKPKHIDLPASWYSIIPQNKVAGITDITMATTKLSSMYRVTQLAIFTHRH